MAPVEARPPIDLLSGSFYANARPSYAWLREHEPVCRDEANGLWALATYDLVQAASRDAATFSNAGGSRPDTGPLPWMIDLDGRDHNKRRRIVSRAFTPGAVRSKQESVRAICDALIDAVCDHGEADVVRDLAAPLPLIVIGDMLGVPASDRAQLLRWSDDLLATLSGDPSTLERAASAFGEYSDYATATIAARRAEPADDLFTALVHAEVDGEYLRDDELVMESLLILVGGDETTRHVITGGTEQLLLHPVDADRLRSHPDAIPTAIEEMLRWVSPIKSMNRTLTCDVELHGQTLERGDKVLLLYEAANFDDAQFHDPERFDITRTPNEHVAFGFGAHHCLGAGLARMELRVMFGQMLSRLPGLAIAGTITRDPVGAIAQLPVTFTSSGRG